MSEIRLRDGSALEQLSDAAVKVSGALNPVKSMYIVIPDGEGGKDLVHIRDFPASAPTETPATPTADALPNWDVQVAIGVNPTSYWRRVTLWIWPGDTLFATQWIAPGLTTSVTFLFGSESDGISVRARVQYAQTNGSPYLGPFSAFSEIVTIAGGL